MATGSAELPLAALAALPKAFGDPLGRAAIKSTPEDFRVDEILGYEPEREGTHVWLKITKRGVNTQWVAERLAAYAGRRQVDVGFAGLKDRQALATQWFSVNVAGSTPPPWEGFVCEGVTLVETRPAARKIRRGALAGNRFTITLRELSVASAALEARLTQIATHGYPNYFGEQRFGRALRNLEQAGRMFAGLLRPRRHQRGLYISAARSWLFNRVLATRIESNCWDRVVPGDVVMLAGSHSVFEAEVADEALQARCRRHDIHPAGPLWGCGGVRSTGEARAFEQAALEHCEAYMRGLEAADVSHAARALRAVPTDLDWRLHDAATLELEFSLAAGSYATVLLRELIDPL